MITRYPLERLAELREVRATGAAIDLAAALGGEAAADAEVTAARAAVEAARAAARGVPLAGATAVPAWAVIQREAWAMRLRRELARCQARLAAVEAERDEWRTAVALGREQATSARADHQVVERHRERWEDGERKKRERREE